MAAGLGAKEGDAFALPWLGRQSGFPRFDRPQDPSQAAIPAEGIADCERLRIGQLLCDPIHSRLPAESFTEWHGSEFSPDRIPPNADGGRVKRIKVEADIRDRGEGKPPTVAQIGGGFERTVGARIIKPGNGSCRNRSRKLLEAAFFGILEVAEAVGTLNRAGDQDLPDSAGEAITGAVSRGG